MSRPSSFLPTPDRLLDLWETRAGRALRKVGLGSVRTTIFTLAVLATLIPALATGWISYRQNRRAIEAKLQGQLKGSSDQAAREVGLWVKERLYDLRVFAASYEVTENVAQRGGGSRRLTEYLSSINERFNDLDQLMVVRPDLRVVASTAPESGGLKLTDDQIRQVREGAPVLGDPERPDSTADVTMEMAVPIVNAAGRFLGIFAARINFDGARQPMRALLAGADGRLVVVRPDGRVIVAVGGSLTSLTEASLRRLEDAEGTSVAYDAPNGTEMIGVLAQVPRTDWKVVAELPASTAYADVRALRDTTILLVLVLLLVVGSLAYLLGLLIVLPLERLSSAAARVAGGDLDVDVPTAGGGEVSQLAGDFNEMVRRLRDGHATLERLSVTDELTGLANRRRLTAELEREILRSERHSREFAVLMLDVDLFKQFNDTHGHPAGDAALVQLARILTDNAREEDLVARYGGEEFLLILSETPAAAAARTAERIRVGAERHRFAPEAGAAEVGFTVSIGYAIFPEHGRTAEALITAADQAMYRSKSAGRNRVTAAKDSAPSPPRKSTRSRRADKSG